MREFAFIKRYLSLKVALFASPFLIALLLIFIFKNETMQQLPIAIVDQDHSVTSRLILRKLEALPEIKISDIHRYADLNEAKKALRSTQVYGVIYIPPNFEQAMLAGQSPEIVTFYNNQFMTIGSAINRSLYTGLANLLIEEKVQSIMAYGTPYKIALEQVSAVSVRLNPVFNPTLSFIFTLVNGAYPVMMQIVIMLIMTCSMQAEWQHPTQFRAFNRTGNYSVFHLIAHKFPIYFSVFFIGFLFFDLILIDYFKLVLAGDYAILLLSTALFIFASMSMAMMFSLLIPDKLRNYGLISVLTSPAFGFTGLIFPHLAMNLFAEGWSAIIPVNWFVKIRLNQTLRGDDLVTIYPSLLILVAMIFLSLLVAQWRLNRLKHADENSDDHSEVSACSA